MPISEPNLVTETANAGAATRLVMRRSDDWHAHLRDGEMLIAVVNETAQQLARAIVMPNLDSPVTTFDAVHAYRSRIIAAVVPGLTFNRLQFSSRAI